MRVTIQHHKTPEEVKAIVDRSIDDAFKGLAMGPVQIQDTKKSWEDNSLAFSMIVKAGFLTTPIKGTVLVGPTDVTIDCDLGLLNKLIPEEKAKALVETRIRGLIA